MFLAPCLLSRVTRSSSSVPGSPPSSSLMFFPGVLVFSLCRRAVLVPRACRRAAPAFPLSRYLPSARPHLPSHCLSAGARSPPPVPSFLHVSRHLPAASQPLRASPSPSWVFSGRPHRAPRPGAQDPRGSTELGLEFRSQPAAPLRLVSPSVKQAF